jgi:hypothetical protein
MSGYTAGAINRQSLIDQGATLLQKPFTPAVLAAAVRTSLAGPGSGQDTDTMAPSGS